MAAEPLDTGSGNKVPNSLVGMANNPNYKPPPLSFTNDAMGNSTFVLPYPGAPHDGGAQDIANRNAIVGQESSYNQYQQEQALNKRTWLDDLAIAANIGLDTAGLAGVIAGPAAAAGGVGAGVGDTAGLGTLAGDSFAGADAAAAATDIGLSAGLGTGAGVAGGATGLGVTGDLETGLTVTAAGDAGAGGIGAGGIDLATGAPLLASLNGAPGAITDTGATLAPGGGMQFLGASDTAPSLQSLPPDVAQSLGISPEISLGDAQAGAGDPMTWDALTGETDTSLDPFQATASKEGFSPLTQSFGSKAADYFSSPRGLATLASLGISGATALSKPKLPGALNTAEGNANALGKSELPIIQSGGTAGPQWAGQKASIDATIDQQIKTQTAALMQAAENSGMGNANSGIVQEQIQTLKGQMEIQRQQLYEQAQAQNVSAAIQALSGADATLTDIGNTELQQSEEARAIAAQTAELALLLASGGAVKIPGA